MRSIRSGRLLAASGLVATALTMVGSADARPDSTLEYVALGDSRAAAPDRVVGPGVDGCGRSAYGYPVVLARTLRPKSFVDVSCSGATSANVLTTAQVTTAADGREHRAAPQVSALGASTSVVTISIGGNDIRWWEVVSSCFPPEQNTDTRCRLDPNVRARADRRLADLSGSVEADLDAIVARAPNATVVVVGHGGIYGLTGCGAAATFSLPDALWVADFFGRLDAVLRERALAHHARFIDVRRAAVGHESCAPADRRWFEGNVSGGRTPERHPTPLGGHAIADLVADALR